MKPVSRSVTLPPFSNWLPVPEPVLPLDREPIDTRLTFRDGGQCPDPSVPGLTRAELTRSLRTLSSGTIAQVIGSDRYADIDRAVTAAILYAIEKATEDEIKRLKGFPGVLSFLAEHRDYSPVSVQL